MKETNMSTPSTIIKHAKETSIYRYGVIGSFFACIKCESLINSIETIRRADGNALQLVICGKCGYKWKEQWRIENWST